MTYLSPFRMRTMVQENYGLQVSSEALDLIESHVEEVVEKAARVTKGAGGKRVTVTSIRRALNEK